MEATSQVALTHPPQPYGAYTCVCLSFHGPRRKSHEGWDELFMNHDDFSLAGKQFGIGISLLCYGVIFSISIKVRWYHWNRHILCMVENV